MQSWERGLAAAAEANRQAQESQRRAAESVRAAAESARAAAESARAAQEKSRAQWERQRAADERSAYAERHQAWLREQEADKLAQQERQQQFLREQEAEKLARLERHQQFLRGQEAEKQAQLARANRQPEPAKSVSSSSPLLFTPAPAAPAPASASPQPTGPVFHSSPEKQKKAQSNIRDCLYLSEPEKAALEGHLNGEKIIYSRFLSRNDSEEMNFGLIKYVLCTPGYEKEIPRLFLELESNAYIEAVVIISDLLISLEAEGQHPGFKVDLEHLQLVLAMKMTPQPTTMRM